MKHRRAGDEGEHRYLIQRVEQETRHHKIRKAFFCRSQSMSNQEKNIRESKTNNRREQRKLGTQSGHTHKLNFI